MTKMTKHIYTIRTDSGMLDDFETDSVGAALDEFDAPRKVRSIDAFEEWLQRVGGYGWIEEDGVRIAEAI